MNAEQQRIAIAEACGWGPRSDKQPPDYLNDLNAMHEAVQAQDWDATQCATYVKHLEKPTTSCLSFFLNRTGEHKYDKEDIYSDAFEMTEATASQRAEAFLRTIGKWRDSQ